MTLLSKTTLVAIMGLTLAACGGSDGEAIASLTDAQRLDNYTSNFQSSYNWLQSTNISTTNTMNNAEGTATYKGEGGLLVNPTVASADATLIGAATVNVNFDSGKVTGSVTDIVGTNRSNVVDGYTGSVRITNGELVGNGSSLMSGNYTGTLQGNNQQFTVSGPLDGYLVGNNTPRGIAMTGTGTSTLGINGTSQLVIIADR